MKKLPRTYLIKEGFMRARQVASFLKSDNIKSIIEELISMELTDTFETSLRGFEWQICGNNLEVKNIIWERKK